MFENTGVFLHCLAVFTCLTEVDSSKPPSVSEPSSKTIIAYEVPKVFFSDLFILGGYTGGDESRCTENSLKSPCSIPISHIIPPGSPAAYQNWASGDKHLDLEGREPQQGYHKEEKAYGTPLRMVGLEDAKRVLRVRDLAYRPNQAYWMVELEMDCNKTKGYFEVESVVRTRTNKMMYESLKRPLPNGFTPINARKFPKFGSSFTDPSRSGDKTTSFTEPESFLLTKQCVGTVHIDFPYDSHRHIGLCGRVNIFRFRLPYCEINEIKI